MASPSDPSPSDPPKPAPAQSYSTDPALYIYTSLTAGSSHIVTATSRLETILRANRVPFKAIDIATDEKARMLWGRRAGKDEGGRQRKLPGLVQMGMVLGDLVEIEDWNEYGELKQHVTIYHDEFTQPPIGQAPPKMFVAQPAKPSSSLAASSSAPGAAGAPPPPPPAAPPLPTEKKEEGGGVAAAAAKVAQLPIRSIAEEAAAKAKQVRLQSLREKVYGKGDAGGEKEADKKEEKEDDKVEETKEEKEDKKKAEDTKDESESEDKSPAPSTTPARLPLTPRKSSTDSAKAPGMQSPTTGTWRDGASTDNVLRTLQSPTTTSWRPTDVDAPITSYRGSLVTSPSEEEIAAVERAETIEEEEEPESSSEEESEEDEKDETADEKK
ncbi:hypothetical protein CONLIGDRAFT_567748 [Coniochaeta ligniaria NRRL 30616]|uniref:Thioredoxin-like protein n=1 Tax=Coniochaeta ligniaria NRRL 30616 TaxID=1408157 RepID=A0A1J7J6F5_9PEZI|nr:hypothetical protein CONLIGDRAFT_567748 [Coniochaeta ligniaria NRRL 30616]